MIRLSLLLLLLVSAGSVMSQQDTLKSQIKIVGTAFEDNGLYISDLLIINERTYTGHFGNTDGSFKVYSEKNDTLIFGALGYNSFKVSFADSAYKEEYQLRITLTKLEYNIGEAEIIAQRDLDDIQRDIEKLGYTDKDYRTTGANALSSPITFLYEALSRREQSKRLVIKMENDDRRRELLKELFAKYADYEIIDLEMHEFDDFVTYLNISDDFLKASSQYDFVIYVKAKFSHFKTLKRAKNLDDGDFNYHEDD
jgi:hypothetical protein